MAPVIGILVWPLLLQAGLLWEPPKIWAEASLPKATESRDLVPRFGIGSLQVTLEKTPLAAVAAHFGAPSGRSGDASESLSWVCLQGQDQHGAWSLWVESGEIHGPTVGGFLLLRRSASDQLDSRCQRVDGAIVLPIPIHLGMSRAQVISSLGPPASHTNARMVYHAEAVVMITTQPGAAATRFDVSSILYFRLSGDTVDGMQVWRTTSS
jgi:hypothetical protein